MNDAVTVGLIGGLSTVVVGFLSGWFVYRRAVKVDLQKIEQERGATIAEQWKAYSETLRKDLAEQDGKLDKQSNQIEKLVNQNHELMASLAEARRDIGGLQHDNEVKARQISRLEKRLNDLEGEDRESA